MNLHSRIIPAMLLAASALLGAQKRGEPLEQFEFQGRIFRLNAVFSPNQADLQLRGRGGINLSAGMTGENILLGTRIGRKNFYVFWLNYCHKALHLAYYDHQHQRSRILPLTGFSFFGLPEILETNGELQALVFLGDNLDNVDIFHYQLAMEVLTPLTRTPFSEKNIILQETGNGLGIETRSLWSTYRYHFDCRNRQVRLLDEERFSNHHRSTKCTAAAIPAEYFNTYIGFGDSITWGEIEGVQRLDLCYLTKMRDVYLTLDYGPADFINLGIPGNDTYDAARRVDQELDNYTALYFLIMLGVNDVWHRSFSLSNAMENLEYIINAAKARSMRVIVSTPTPSKSTFSSYSYYWENLRELSAGILALAQEKNVVSIDPLTAFMNTNPPDGWKDLLENIIPNISSGNHPNEEGHSVIASLFSTALVQLPPQTPRNITVLDPKNTLRRTASWNPCYESDFSHFHIEFDFLPKEFKYSSDSNAAYHTFLLFPFLPQLYFRIQAVDRGDHASDFSTLERAAASDMAPPKSKKKPIGLGKKKGR